MNGKTIIWNGALESVFSRAVRYWTGKKIGFIIAQKMGMDNSDAEINKTRGFYLDGQHLNANDYEYTTGIIEKWLLSL